MSFHVLAGAEGLEVDVSVYLMQYAPPEWLIHDVPIRVSSQPPTTCFCHVLVCIGPFKPDYVLNSPGTFCDRPAVLPAKLQGSYSCAMRINAFSLQAGELQSGHRSVW